MIAPGPYAVHFDEKCVRAAVALVPDHGLGARVRQVIAGDRSPATVWHSTHWQGFMWAMHEQSVPFAVGQGVVPFIAIGDVPDAPEIQAPDEDGVDSRLARMWRIRWCAAIDGIDRDERIERLRTVVDAISILDVCCPAIAATYRVNGRTADGIMRQIRTAIGDMESGKAPAGAVDSVMDAQSHAVSSDVVLRMVRARLRADPALRDAVRRLGELTSDVAS